MLLVCCAKLRVDTQVCTLANCQVKGSTRSQHYSIRFHGRSSICLKLHADESVEHGAEIASVSEIDCHVYFGTLGGLSELEKIAGKSTVSGGRSWHCLTIFRKMHFSCIGHLGLSLVKCQIPNARLDYIDLDYS